MAHAIVHIPLPFSSDGFAVAVGTTEGSISVFDQDLQVQADCLLAACKHCLFPVIVTTCIQRQPPLLGSYYTNAFT